MTTRRPASGARAGTRTRAHARVAAAVTLALLAPTLAACSPLPTAPSPLPATFIPQITPSPRPSADLVAGFTPLERVALRVRVRTCAAYGTGTAWMLDEKYAVTNRHVIEGATDIALTAYNGEEFGVKSSVLDRDSDLALITIDGTFPEAAIIGDSEPGLANELTVAGYPEGEALHVVTGPYRGLVSDDVGTSEDLVYQIMVVAKPGNSGSPVANDDGEVVGVLYAADSSSTAYAVSLPSLNRFLDDPSAGQRNRASC